MTTRERLRPIARHLAPGVMADRARRYERGLRERQGVTRAAERMEPVVQAGPFVGLRYPPGRIAEVDAPVAKLRGSYERELTEVFSSLADCPLFIDIGSADGYFAVGVARASPGTVVHAYDIARSARELCAAVASLNSVQGRVIVRRRFALGRLSGLDLTGALLLCDIEGDERRLFDAALAARLAPVRVVIEVHESIFPGTGAYLRRLFAPTHAVRVIRQQGREEPELEEHRPSGLHWLCMTPIAPGDAPSPEPGTGPESTTTKAPPDPAR
jgi:hypothetical protein